jgi:hypothetical protein
MLMSRLRYLRHLPVASSFEVAELELGEPVVSKVNLPCLQYIGSVSFSQVSMVFMTIN